MEEKQIWWGEHYFALAETKVWRIGTRSVAIKRCAKEWQLWNNQEHQEVNKPIVLDTLKAHESFDDKVCSRYVLASTGEALIIEPSLADRAMIVKPGIPFSISPGEKVVVYVSTPIWMTVLVPGKEVPLADIAFWRPSDSWFGPSTMNGDLCYSKYTDARLDEGALVSRGYRATTKVSLQNDQETGLTVERLNIPVPALKLYVDAMGRFWTDDISIVQTHEHNKSISQLVQSIPKRGASLKMVSESREMSKKSSFLSSIRSLVD